MSKKRGQVPPYIHSHAVQRNGIACLPTFQIFEKCSEESVLLTAELHFDHTVRMISSRLERSLLEATSIRLGCTYFVSRLPKLQVPVWEIF